MIKTLSLNASVVVHSNFAVSWIEGLNTPLNSAKFSTIQIPVMFIIPAQRIAVGI